MKQTNKYQPVTALFYLKGVKYINSQINPSDVIANLLANKVRFSTRTFGENEADTLEIFSKSDWHLCKSLFPRLFDLSNDERSEPVAKATFRL